MLAHTFRVGSSHWTTRQLAQVRHQCSRFNQWGEMGISSQKSSCLSTNHGYDLHDHLWRDLWFIGQIMVGDTNLTIRAYLYLWLCCFNPTKSTHCKENSTQEYVPRSYKKKSVSHILVKQTRGSSMADFKIFHEDYILPFLETCVAYIYN